MPGPLFARDGDVSLRLCEEDDLEFVQANRNHPAVRGPLTDSTPRNRKQAEGGLREPHQRRRHLPLSRLRRIRR